MKRDIVDIIKEDSRVKRWIELNFEYIHIASHNDNIDIEHLTQRDGKLHWQDKKRLLTISNK